MRPDERVVNITRPRCKLCGKLCFLSEQEAWSEIERLSEQHYYHVMRGKEPNVYWCQHSRSWHWGSRRINYKPDYRPGR